MNTGDEEIQNRANDSSSGMHPAESLFPRVESLLQSIERPARYLNHEWGAIHHPEADYRCALIYPDTYEIGQANQAIAILYAILNAHPHTAAERCYVPWMDMSDALRAQEIPLFSLESCTALASFDLIGFTLPHELACTNVLEALDLAQIPLHASDRNEDYPLVIAGGPCALNPEPYVPFFDLFVIGEGEEVILELVDAHRRLRDEGSTKNEILTTLSLIEGIYVPAIDDVNDNKPVHMRRVLANFASFANVTQPIVPFVDVTHDRVNVEVLRGCSRGCRFCQAGMMYRPVRERSADAVVNAVMCGLSSTGYEEVSLTSLSTTDHSQLESILRRLNARLAGTGVRISIPSQRVDAFGIDMAHLVAGEKKGGLTFAPEAGTQRLRDCINKNITEEDILSTIAYAYEAGWRRCKLYFMCGLPTETDEDLRGIGELVGKAYRLAKDSVPDNERGNVRMTVSLALFVPKPHTPFQWCGQVAPEEVRRRIAVIREAIPWKGVDFSWHESTTSTVEAALARGGREMGAVIEAAWRDGARFDAWSDQYHYEHWKHAMEETGTSILDIAHRDLAVGEPLPWSHISTGVDECYLIEEYQKALAGATTPDCTFGACTGCGACGNLGCNIDLAGERRG